MMREELLHTLSQSNLFEGVEPSAIEALLLGNVYSVKEYTKNDVFAIAGDKVGHLMVVLEGSLIARMVSDSGKFVQIDKIDVGRVIAPAMIFASDSAFPVNVIPDGDAKVFFVRKDIFLEAMQHNERLLFNFIQIVSNINKFLSTKIHSLSLKTIRGKLAEYILQLSIRQGGSDVVTLGLTRQELADKFAVTRQALSRSLSELEEEGLIEVSAKRVTIKSRSGLKST